MPRLLTVYGLSRELGMSVESLRRRIDEGIIPPGERRSGHEMRVFTEDQARRIRNALARSHNGQSRPWPELRLR